MATDIAPVMNGVYDTQFNQPAELAASTPSQSLSNTQNSSSSTAAQQKADPQEIGWYFVEQYYTTLSKTPERIHLFYSKKSQLVTGVEAEKVVPVVGTKAISEKIKSLDFQDCKVRVLNVDCQSSFDNIVVQVIGEMSNKSQPHHKFVQTFVLATQPNGYFVLNDIFRYLNDEEDEIVDDQPAEEQTTLPEETAKADTQVEAEPTTLAETPKSDTEITAVDEKLEQAQEPSVLEEQAESNGVDANVVTSESEPVEEAVIEDQQVTIPAPEQPPEPEPTPRTQSPSRTSNDGPPTKKTWANMVGTKATAIPALPTTTTTTTTTTTSSTNSSKAPKPAPSVTTPKPSAEPAAVASSPTTSTHEWQTAEGSKKAKGAQGKSSGEAVVYAYIKNVTDKVDARVLRSTLEQYGELKYFDVSRPRNCAFVEFADPAGYAAAVAANPHDIGGESISVEERRPRPGAFGGNNPSFTRGGSTNGRARGGMQARTGSQSGFQKEGRGGFQQRGTKSGNVTPKGRGQAPNS